MQPPNTGKDRTFHGTTSHSNFAIALGLNCKLHPTVVYRSDGPVEWLVVWMRNRCPLFDHPKNIRNVANGTEQHRTKFGDNRTKQMVGCPGKKTRVAHSLHADGWTFSFIYAVIDIYSPTRIPQPRRMFRNYFFPKLTPSPDAEKNLRKLLFC